MIILDWDICDSSNLKLIWLYDYKLYVLKKILVSDLLLISEYCTSSLEYYYQKIIEIRN